VSADYSTEYSTARARIYAKLSDLKWHSHRELGKIGGNRYGARIGELRRLGYLIQTVAVKGDGRRYKLNSLERKAAIPKRVKVYLSLDDAQTIAAWGLPPGAVAAVEAALESYHANRSKL
jgi:hypothetical protein